MNQGDFVSIIGGRGYIPGIIKEVGKRTILIEWADDTSERIDKSRVIECRSLRERTFVERMFYLEEQMSERFRS